MAWVILWKYGQQPPTDVDWVLVEVGIDPVDIGSLQRPPVTVFHVSADIARAEIKRAIYDAKEWAEARNISRVVVRTD